MNDDFYIEPPMSIWTDGIIREYDDSEIVVFSPEQLEIIRRCSEKQKERNDSKKD